MRKLLCTILCTTVMGSYLSAYESVGVNYGNFDLVRGKGFEVLKKFCAQFGDEVKQMQK